MHYGEVLTQILKDANLSSEEVAKKLKIGRVTFWRWQKKEDLPIYYLKIVTDIINVDLLKYIPEAYFLYPEKNQEYDKFKEKYFLLLEKYNKLLEKTSQLQD